MHRYQYDWFRSRALRWIQQLVDIGRANVNVESNSGETAMSLASKIKQLDEQLGDEIISILSRSPSFSSSFGRSRKIRKGLKKSVGNVGKNKKSVGKNVKKNKKSMKKSVKRVKDSKK